MMHLLQSSNRVALSFCNRHASRVWQISKGGGHNFTAEVTAVGDNGSYDYDSMIFYVSEKVDKNEFHNASNYIKGTAEIYQDHLRENIKLGGRKN
ncbi:hypothetical protein JTM05_34200 [Pseudomonas aeruginosa]|nr:hypothetical protein [Pseudomonas aeruginosa]